ncbi:hypothetical protein AX15_000585 [Amanita polypyramis BW_CC]|nr:hypothetical protein AX15_000585 [Amanita polypyramis BW_CC]
MANIGSVFLGDVQRHRVFSSSSPPGSPPSSSIYTTIPSPPPIKGTSGNDHNINNGDNDNIEGEVTPAKTMTAPPEVGKTLLKGRTAIDPMLALELRVRWLEALVLGIPENNPGHATLHRKVGSIPLRSKQRSISGGEGKAALLKHGETLVRLAKDVQSRLDAAVEANEGLKRFMVQYDQHAHLLTPASALSGILADSRQGGPLQTAPEYASMSPEEFEALLQEMEPDIRAADRDMREIEMLEKKGVTGAGRLAEYEKLQPRLEALIKAHKEDLELVASLEKRIATLMKRHATQVDALSELFVAWDDTLTEAEGKVTRLEREKAERLRLGLEKDTY